MTSTRSYHHGDLRRALLAAAADAMAESGPAALSLRDLARRAGVSHAAPAHHFGDKAGLLTALATQGFELLGEALRAAGDDLRESGVAYVGFAVRHRAHFEVMFRPDLYRADDPDLVAARERAGELLRSGVARHTGREPDVDSLAAWSIVHGFATLWLAGALPARVGPDPEAAARTVIGRLFP
ncbi:MULTISPECIES: TetR/AcrR family transcriptional regulator [Micromonospora]|uniref:TetR/AcrR family transcriptional regulator n=1 Tax=Micromonospora solifontis TaxID=2487138 RepID=A0ABX9WM52_9ACTN|nr:MULTISPECIES: TetR/AcrR family transcriptional regulator [Micromonospora]NES14367.1 TetR/AcrR family transcriptional regulator [Micromonospora sp. PPF5-17B]NES35025.1 TetR/AcrR family transcriptional regulator [Micromonospora solifontis]NES57474.1 TetR/AcrR family transcriptional regulator [Micromonospora sp. PPF5-6]RNM01296.1 TetR/AcrR family transcriptional regulator [Micromonospora solifontis]